MSDPFSTQTYRQTGDWVLGTARRNPEALLLLAAGACLLMRGASSWNERRTSPNRGERIGYEPDSLNQTRSESEARSVPRRFMSQAGDAVSRVTDTATEYASDIADAAGSYADSVSRYAQNAGTSLYEQSERVTRQAQSTVQETVSRIVREQPLAVALAGLAAGATIAAIFPSTRVESRTFGGARDALTQAASKAGENLADAAAQAGERLVSAAAERGLSSDGLKNLAGEVAETFTNAMRDGTAGRASPSIAPGQPRSEVRRSGVSAPAESGTRSKP